MRIAFAEIGQETDSFTPLRADLSDFQAYGLYFGNEVLERMQGVGPLGGFLEIAAQQTPAPELLPILRAWGSAGGTITAETRDYLVGRLLDGLRASLPVDAVFLSLHGAAASEGCDDVEGLILAEVRRVVGSDVPIAAALDHHANVTRQMVENANLLVGHETQPHDPPATGRKTAKLLFGMLRGEIRPVIRWRKIPLITPQDQFLTSAGPMREWFEAARELELRDHVLDVSPYPMQPWLDVAEGGWSVIVHTDNRPELADQLATLMAMRAWDRRDQFWVGERVPADEAVRLAESAPKGLVILSDTGDSVYGGAPGDSTCILKALLEQRSASLAFVPLVDPESLATAMSLGVGAEIDRLMGAASDQRFSRPVRVNGRIAALSNGITVNLIDRGLVDMKQTALIESNNVRIVLLGHRSFAINHPVLYTHLGLDMCDAKMVVVKTASNFQFFQRWRSQLIRVDSPGATQSDLRAFEWKRIPHPIYPLDDGFNSASITSG